MSSTNQLKAVATGKAEKPKDIAHLLASAAVQNQIKAALPRHMTPERMARIATTEMRKVPKLRECDPMSFLGAVIQCAQLGLEPGNALGHAYILPFDKREKVGGQWKTVRTEAQVIIGYRGMIDLARRSGQIVSIDARAVFEGDRFNCELGLDPKIEHVPDWQNPNRADPDKLRFVYAVAKLKDGGVQFDVMSRADVDAIRARSQSASKGPWVTDYAAMAVKTVVRRLFKFLPVSIEMQTAVGLDEMAEAGLGQNNGAVIDADFVFTDDEPDPFEPQGPDGAQATFAEIADLVKKAKTADQLELVQPMLEGLPDDQRAELQGEIERRQQQISNQEGA